jgi:hypothetical protein
MAFSTDEAHGNANHTSTTPVTTEQVGSPPKPKRLRNIMLWAYTWLWARGRMALLLFILTILALILTHTTIPLVVHPQYLHTPPKPFN